jgi:hypothetical protein
VPHILSFVKPQAIDELTGTFNALNETTNFMPTQGDGIGVIHPSYKPDPRGYDPGPIGSLSETFGERGYSPISGEGVFKPQDIDTKGSVIWGDNHFKPGRGGDSLAGEGRSMNSWRNADPSPFEDRMAQDFDSNDVVFCNGIDADIQRPTHPKNNLGANSGPGGSTFMTETFEPAAGMDSFGKSLNPVLEVGGTAGPGGSTFMTGQFEMPVDNLGGNTGPGGTTF